jgi:uncharacterized surface protein with fasciclin (FAS1) repeats
MAINLSFSPATTSLQKRVVVNVMIEKIGAIPGLLFITALLCTGVSLAQDNNTTTETGVIDALQGMELGEFSAAIESAGLVDTLNDKGVLTFNTGSFVIFAPSDEAFAAASGVDMNALKENPAELKKILFYHIIWNSGSFDNISEISSAKTMLGENLSLDSTAGLKVNGANVTASGNYDSGVIYVVDKVLLAETDASLGVVEAANDLGAKKFGQAVASSGLADTLNGQGLMGIEGLTSGPYTVFAPSDAAYANAKSSLDAISKKDNGMLNLLSYHVVEAQGLLNMTASNSIKTMLGDSLAVDVNLSLVGGANVLGSERYDNGIVYVIDQVLMPISLSM